ncbi:hypothetical protein B0A48_12363 [Cryoendolithus antarcticus]|uniref:Uncharacterized protein n=1 Tax=Cryoendolithus antarcticus TaxID=1507870 RepID=A0A1V8SS35_9PEZI|nr:hypothetical protein B0A48_12363 [Cryoendolithus antarcticus]
MANKYSYPLRNTTHSQAQSSLFRLSAHLRRTIFKLAFGPAQEPDPMVDLIELAPPESEILLVCQQVYLECKALHASVVMQYWDQDFYIDVLALPDSTNAFEHLSDKILLKIASLTSIPPRFNSAMLPRVVINTFGCTYFYPEVGPG